MNRLPKSNDDLEPRIAATLLEVLIRAGLILILTIICYQVFSPFMILVVWAVILAVTLYPLHQRIARRVGGRQGIASTLLLIVGFVLIAVPTAILVNSLGDTVNELIHKVQANSLQIPAAWEREESKLKDDLMTLARAIEKHIEELNHFMVRNQNRPINHALKSEEPTEITGGTLKRSEMDYRGHHYSGPGRTRIRRDLS